MYSFIMLMMQYSYYDQGLQDILSNSKMIFKVLKNKTLVERTMNIIRLIQISSNLGEIAMISGVRLHPLTEDLSWLYSLDVPNKVSWYRIIFMPLNWEDVSKDIITNLPPNPKLKTITNIMIIDRCDDHITKNKTKLKQRLQSIRNKNI